MVIRKDFISDIISFLFNYFRRESGVPNIRKAPGSLAVFGSIPFMQSTILYFIISSF